MSEWVQDNWDKRFAIVYKCQLSALYHHKRERFLALLDKWATALALVFGSAAMTELLPSATAKAIAGAAVAAVSLPGIVFSWSDSSRRHATLAGKFVALEAEIEGAGVLDASRLDKFNERAISLEVDEPPQLSALTRICQNEIAAAMGSQDAVSKVSWHERWFANLFDMPKMSSPR